MNPPNAHLPSDLTGDQVNELMQARPGVRGFWTDGELLQASGLTSVALLKKLHEADFVWPRHAPIPGGGRRRTWSLKEVARVELAAKIAADSGISIQAVAALLVCAGVPWVDAASRIDERVQTLDADYEKSADNHDHDRTARGTRIILVKMTEAWIEDSPGEFNRFSSQMKLSGTPITVKPGRDPRPRSVRSVSELNEPVVTILNLAAVRLGAFDQALQDRMSANRAW